MLRIVHLLIRCSLISLSNLIITIKSAPIFIYVQSVLVLCVLLLTVNNKGLLFKIGNSPGQGAIHGWHVVRILLDAVLATKTSRIVLLVNELV